MPSVYVLHQQQYWKGISEIHLDIHATACLIFCASIALANFKMNITSYEENGTIRPFSSLMLKLFEVFCLIFYDVVATSHTFVK